MPVIIMCVDDDTTILQAVRTLLNNTLGRLCRVEIAESGEEALEICDELAADGQAVGVVISDFIMPVMRGDELLVRLHQQHPAMIKIMLTGQSDFAGVKRVINEANLYRFIEKPFNNADLVLTARAAVGACERELALQARIDDLEQQLARLSEALEARGGRPV